MKLLPSFTFKTHVQYQELFLNWVFSSHSFQSCIKLQEHGRTGIENQIGEINKAE